MQIPGFSDNIFTHLLAGLGAGFFAVCIESPLDMMLEINNGTRELNIPISDANKKLVASENGGLQNPYYLIFNPEWDSKEAPSASKRFNYPSAPGVQKPSFDEDIAFMIVLELGQLIKTKQISSEELTWIFLKRLKRAPSIPYGLKDIIAVPQYKTTWGSTSFKDQVLDVEAWVYKRLSTVGALRVFGLLWSEEEVSYTRE